MPHHDEYAYNPGDIAYFQGQDLKKVVAQLAARVEKLEAEVKALKIAGTPKVSTFEGWNPI